MSTLRITSSFPLQQFYSSSSNKLFVNPSLRCRSRNGGKAKLITFSCSASPNLGLEQRALPPDEVKTLENDHPKPGVLFNAHGWTALRANHDDLDMLKKFSQVQAEAFHAPFPFFDDFFFSVFKGEVLSSLLHKIRHAGPKRFACLVAVPDYLQGEETKVVGVVDAAAMADRHVLNCLPGVDEYLYISGMAVDTTYRRQKVATVLLQACDLTAMEWGFEYLVLQAYEDDKAARLLYARAGYTIISIDPLWLSQWLGRRRKDLESLPCSTSMAFVFKVKFQDTLRRWVAPEAPADSFAVTFKDLDSKIRELFHFSTSALIAITYLDKDNDVVTLADDQDLIDACFVQSLNPLRLDVQVLDGSSKEHARGPQHSFERPSISAETLNVEAFLRALPQATADSVKEFLRIYAPCIDPKVPAADSLKNIESVFKDFINSLANHHHHGHGKFGEKPPHHANRHHWSPPSHPRHEDTTFHWGVECDGCGTSPIQGSRYKSTKESNYDLCENCFIAIGNESDYLKLDRPVHHPPHHGHYRPPCLRRGPKPFMAPPVCRASFARGQYGWKPNHPFSGHHSIGGPHFDEHKKLDARFVKDVTIFDGTELSPGTNFTKIWRMSNIGTLPWPQGTRLVHIGGDVLGTDKAVSLELPESGVPCGEEAEVSVDLVTPEKAGRYVSHWRLSAPSGQKFGHRVWVVIHVVPHGEKSPQFQASLQAGEKGIEASEDTIVQDNNDGANTRKIDVNTNGADKATVGVVIDSVSGVLRVEQSGPADYENNTKILYPDPTSFHVDDDVEKCKLEVDDDFSLVEKPSENTDWFDVFEPGLGQKERLVEEGPLESLLQALEAMGFTDRNINISTSQSCNFELDSTVDKLLAAFGWEWALKDLEEMGFNDKPTNVRMLVKNKGSLKQTVKDLVKLEKQ
ncbi:hypothetical protein GOP47_0018406 [Adiantum capillus-veneris]|uniref:Uncharacterized protein n=1 Tax=Adiantum capillus-veneris TaxID=13818 RepID=A0A9D4Z9L5_ADICA|nr:hypothetical protein GOP47_0018406 [Adiantum capillus-veneris]